MTRSSEGRRRPRPDRWRRLLTAVAVLVLAALPSGPAAPATARPAGPAVPAPGPGSGGDPVSVTLVTGDRVALTERDGDLEIVSVVPGPGREGMGFHAYEVDGQVYVVPADAVALVDDGRVDRRLFDVAGLVAAGYDDAGRPDLPLIVSGGGDARARSAATRELPSLSAVARSEDKSGVGAFWAGLTRDDGPGARSLTSGVTGIWLDGPVRASLDTTVSQVGAPAAWEAGHTGEGAAVAVLDTGIDPNHPDLAGAVIESRDFTGSPNGTADGHGHGTHVASIITGDGTASGGRYRGVAPDARLLVAKVLGDDGYGLESQVIAGMEWAAAADVPVANLSLGSGYVSDGTAPIDQAVDHLTATTGTLFVVAAGNAGPQERSVQSPGTADAALTVGAVDDDDRLADFSSRGPRPDRPAIKPDLTAPGVDVVAARAEGTSGGRPVDEHHTAADGTSMATPHVSGAAVILAAQHPDWDGPRLKSVLMGSADLQDGQTAYEQGAGRLDVARADAQSVSASPASVHGGVASWPHDDDDPVVTPVNYRNDGPEAVTLDLDADVHDAAGEAAPAGMFTTSVDRVVVPAGAEATVDLRIDTTVDGPDGRYEGRLVAGGPDGTRVVTPVAVDREVESYEVTLDVRDRAGRPATSYSAVLIGIDEPLVVTPYDPGGRPVVRVPKGRYTGGALIFQAGSDEFTSQALVVEPTIVVEADTVVSADAREAEPAGATVDREGAAVAAADAVANRETALGRYSARTVSARELFLRPSTTSAPDDEFEVAVFASLAQPDEHGDFSDSPYLYRIRWSATGEVPDDVTVHQPDRRLARVEAHYAKTAPGPSFAGIDGILRKELPAVVQEYSTPGVLWGKRLIETGPTGEIYGILDGVHRYSRGRHRERWNAAVFGPADLGPGNAFGWGVRRLDDRLGIDVPLLADQAGHGWSYSPTTSARTRLLRDGEVLLDEPRLPDLLEAPLGAEEAVYRLEAEATRDLVDLSTDVRVAWTFRSARPAGDEPAPVPLLGIHLAPAVDDLNQAPSGRRFEVPVRISRQEGAPSARITTVTVEASFDDGATWQPLPVKGRGADRSVTLDHPDGPGFVSLRATASDTDGNRVEQTIVHAYRLAG